MVSLACVFVPIPGQGLTSAAAGPDDGWAGNDPLATERPGVHIHGPSAGCRAGLVASLQHPRANCGGTGIGVGSSQS